MKPYLFSALVGLAMLGSVGEGRAQQGPASAVAALPAEARKAVYQTAFERKAAELFTELRLGALGVQLPVFRQALVGYYNLRAQASGRQVLTLIDFTKPSSQKRLWVIDLARKKVLFNTLVAHGKNTGQDVAMAFSNKGGSEMSSLGFYRTAGSTYNGKHGLSLKLYGQDPGFNTNAENRAVVVHGAEYVCEEFIRQHGRLGRSQGCPALPVAETSAIVSAIKGGSILYLHGPEKAGFRSRWLNMDRALHYFAQQEGIASLR